MVRRIGFGALAAVFALTLANSASAAFVQAVVTAAGADTFTVDVQIVSEEDASFASVDVSIVSNGGTFTEYQGGGSHFFDGETFGPTGSVAGNSAAFGGSSILGKAATDGEILSMGGAILSFAGDRAAAIASLTVSSDAPYEILDNLAGDLRSDSGAEGMQLRIADGGGMVPEPMSLALLGLGLAGVALRRRA